MSSVAKPTGEYADQMLEPDGWVEVDEQSLHDRAQLLTTTLQQVTSALEGFQHEETEIFSGGVWSGGGADSAQGKLGEVVSDLQGVQSDLVKAITWYQKAADTVSQTKTAIADRVEKAQSQISDLENDTDSDADERNKAIDALVKQVHGANVSDVTSAAGKIPASAGWKAPEGAMKGLLNQKAPPNPAPPAPGGHGHGGSDADPLGSGGGSSGPGAGGGTGHGHGGSHADPLGSGGGSSGPGGGGGTGHGHGGSHADPLGSGGQGSEPGPDVLQQPAAYNGSSPNWSVPSLGGLSSSGGGHGGGGQWGSMLSGLGGGQGGQNNPTGDMFDHHMLDGLQHPDAGLQQTLAQTAMNNAAASAAASAAAQVPLQAAPDATQVAPAAARGPAVTDATVTSGGAAAASGGSVGASAGAGAIGAVPTVSSEGAGSGSAMPLLPPATPHPAAPVSATAGGGVPGASGTSATGSGGPGVHPASTTSVGRAGFVGSVMSSQAEAAPAPIPVSAARAEKDAIADATRRQSGGGDVPMAYRLAAALNAADIVNKGDFKFFWMTAVTADGQIVVANSYGLAFIPEGVNLPAQAIMASADDTVPVEERARWATYPNLALQGWAAHHNTTLRIVIAKREQFAGIDPGVPTQFVADEDIPTSGRMQGRSRLEVVAPADAARLASASDLALVEMLPPAPVDATPPPDQRSTLWFNLMKHVMRSDADRGVAHLQSFATYASHAQDLALHRAHSAVHAMEQRTAIADWLYWRYLHALLGEALARGATA